MTDFDFEGVFDEDYLYFYEETLAKGNDADVERILALIGREGVDVLDCPCGHGRISNALAEHGHRVTGLDASELLPDRARADAHARGVDVEYVHGDMRELPGARGSTSSSTGSHPSDYFDDDANRNVLHGFHAALRPGGRLLMELINPASLLARFMPMHELARGDDLAIDRVTLDLVESRAHTERIIIRDGNVRRTHFSIRMYWYTELRDLLRSVGFDNVHPGVDPSPGNRIVVVADRPSA